MGLKQRLFTAVAPHFGNPTGFLGRLAGWEMATNPGNRRRNEWAVGLLDIQPPDRVLEVGCGPGLALAAAARRAYEGFVAGVDRSDEMVRQARRRNAGAIRAGQIDVRVGSVPDEVGFDGTFDAILAVNSFGFWPEPVECLRVLRSRLRAGGQIAVIVQPKAPGANADTTAAIGHEIATRLSEAGFMSIRSRTLELKPPVVGVLGTSDRSVAPAPGEAAARAAS